MAWTDALIERLRLHTQLIIDGECHQSLILKDGHLLDQRQYFQDLAKDLGFRYVIYCWPYPGGSLVMDFNPEASAPPTWFSRFQTLSSQVIPTSLDESTGRENHHVEEVIESIHDAEMAGAALVIIPFASRLLHGGEQRHLFSLARFYANQPVQFPSTSGDGSLVRPTCIWLADRGNALHHLMDDDSRIARITAERPRSEQRRAFGSWYAEIDLDTADDDLQRLLNEFVNVSEDFTVAELRQFAQLVFDERVDPRTAEIRIRKGATEDLWAKAELIDRIRAARTTTRPRVVGQPLAISSVFARLITAAQGLSNATRSQRRPNLPKAAMWLDGKSGTGKTELARWIAEVVYGNETKLVEFNMSEYREEHRISSLIGSPFGYVGSEEGGKLTNAMREDPFRVLLFDEMEKAHPSVMKLFLQILDLGQLTDGRGEMVYFGQSIIIFTSNISSRAVEGHDAAAVSALSAEETAIRVHDEVRRWFHLPASAGGAGSPELYTRVKSGGIVPFVQLDASAIGMMFDHALADAFVKIEEVHDLKVAIDDSFGNSLKEELVGIVQQPEGSGRDVASLIQERLIDPFASWLTATSDNTRQTQLRITDSREQTENGIGLGTFEITLA